MNKSRLSRIEKLLDKFNSKDKLAIIAVTYKNNQTTLQQTTQQYRPHTLPSPTLRSLSAIITHHTSKDILDKY